MTSEIDLIEGCKKGNHASFEALYNKYAKKMMAIALRYCNTTFEAEDLVQETFIKVFHKIKTFENKGSFEGWLKRILVYNAINHFHKIKKEREFVDTATTEIIDTDSAFIFEKISTEELLSILKSLPIGYRTVFNLYVIEGYTHKEIAELCNINEGTSKSQLSKARAMLQEMVSKNNYILK